MVPSTVRRRRFLPIHQRPSGKGASLGLELGGGRKFQGRITKLGKGHAKILNTLFHYHAYISLPLLKMSSSSDKEDQKPPAVGKTQQNVIGMFQKKDRLYAQDKKRSRKKKKSLIMRIPGKSTVNS